MQPGERQVAPTRDGIRRDHVARYEWAAMALKRRGRVIDLACGIGYGTQLLAQAGLRATGLDKDAEAIAYARKHYAHARASFRRADAGRALRLGALDAAVCFETIEHIEDPLPLLKALHKAAPVLLASVPNEEVFPWQGYAFHYRHYTPAQFEALLNAAGWEIEEWWGQSGPESEVEKGIMGRTIIAVAKRRKAAKAAREIKLHLAAAPAVVPKHVAILALGPSVSSYLELVKRLGGRRKFCDETWGINAIGDSFVCDRIFHMDDVRIQEIRAKAAPERNIAAMLAWMKTHPGPIITSRAHPGYPGLVEFPLQDVVKNLNFAYFNSTVAYAVAYAIHIGVEKLSLFGFDFTYANSHQSEKGRACVEFWLGMAAARGIKITMPQKSSLMDACNSEAERLYGYDTLEVKLVHKDGRLVNVAFKERPGPLPTAEEIEHRYDHSRHPSPLVDK